MCGTFRVVLILGGLADVTTTLGVTFEGYLDYEI